MKRSKKVVFVSHCILNQNARAKGVAKCAGAVKEFLEYCISKRYGIIPIDCPQLQFESLERRPETKEFYDNKKSRAVSREIVKKVVGQIKFYLKNGYRVEVIFGVEGSPTCGAIKTHVLSPETGKSVSVKGQGIFFEELEKVLEKNKLKVKILDWDIQAKKPISK